MELPHVLGTDASCAHRFSTPVVVYWSGGLLAMRPSIRFATAIIVEAQGGDKGLTTPALTMQAYD